ncbi:MAG: DUF1015 domain-containing protein [Thermodesulfobacteriota bacterium]
MATVVPFRGILYNPALVPDMSAVVTPPYDVISPAEQEDFHLRHKNNVIRLILGKKTARDTETDNAHTRAGAFYRKWREENVLRRDAAPALYLCAHEFQHEGGRVTRLGIMARVRLQPFSDKVIRPHEKTFSKVKSERLSLFKQCHANFSPIFSLFQDSESGAYSLLREHAEKTSPDLCFTDKIGDDHGLWRITDPATLGRLTSFFADRELFIADGHHRYETALNYLAWREEKDGPLPPDHPARFVLMYLCSMDDPGLVILPAHRMLSRLEQAAREALFTQAGNYFKVETFPLSGEPRDRVVEKIKAALKNAGKACAMAVITNDPPEARIMTLKPGVMDRLFHEELAPSLRELDVSALTQLVFVKVLGLTQEDLDDHDLIRYTIDPGKVLDMVVGGEVQAGFVINPTRIEHVREVARAGLVMPRKSTYFQPKVVTGLVMNSLEE